MSVTSILAARGCEVVNTRPLADARRAKIEEAVETLQLEIIRLRQLERAAARREENARRARADNAQFAAEAARKSQARVALRSKMLSVDRELFHATMQGVINRLAPDDADALVSALNAVLARDGGGS